MYYQGYEQWHGAARMRLGGRNMGCTPAYKPNVHHSGNILSTYKNEDTSFQELLSVPSVKIGCEDLFLEKYGSAFVEILHRVSSIQQSSHLHNSYVSHAGASPGHLRFNDNRPDNITARQTAEECLYSRYGDNSKSSMDVRGDMDDFEDDSRKVNSFHQMNETNMDQSSEETGLQERREDGRNGSNVMVRAEANPVESLRSLNELEDFRPDRRFGSDGSPLSRDAKKIRSDVTNNCGVRFSTGSKILGNHQDTLKSYVLKNDCDRPMSSRPFRASWADLKPMITPFEQILAESSSKDGSYGIVESDDYNRRRRNASTFWSLMKYYFKEAAAAYHRGERCRAATLSEKGKEFKYFAQKADERASQLIFQSKNKTDIEIDLHALHVGEALQFLEHRLLSLDSFPLNELTVITGYGSHSRNGCAKIKPAVISFLDDNRIPWGEANEGRLTIKLVDVCNKKLDSSDNK